MTTSRTNQRTSTARARRASTSASASRARASASLRQVTVHRAEYARQGTAPPSAQSATKPMACYGLEARAPPAANAADLLVQTKKHPMQVVVDNPEDPIFYSTCLVQDVVKEWLPLQATEKKAASEAGWSYNDDEYCLDCSSYKANYGGGGPGVEFVGYAAEGQGIAGPERWKGGHVTKGQADPVDACYQAVMKDPLCSQDPFTYVARGDKNCGCKTAGALSIRSSTVADYYRVVQPPMTTRHWWLQDKGCCSACDKDPHVECKGTTTTTTTTAAAARESVVKYK